MFVLSRLLLLMKKVFTFEILLTKETWWWNKQIQASIRLKRESYRSIPRCRDNIAYENYKVAKMEGKKVVGETKYKVYDKLYNKLGTNES